MNTVKNMKRTERLSVERRPLWQKLELILDRIDKKGHSGLSRQELEELGGLYRCVAVDLARARAQSANNGQQLQIYLKNLRVMIKREKQQEIIEAINWFFTS